MTTLFELRKPRSCFALLLIAAFLLLGSTSPAFPLRVLQPGTQVPDFTLPVLDGGEANVLGEKGKISIILFWSTDSDSKLERGLELLHTLQTISENYGDQGIAVSSVNVDKDNRDVVRQLIQKDGITVPVLLDENEQLYGAYGLFILPTVAIVDRDGTLKTAVGYTRNISDNIMGEIQVILGLKTVEELERELNPEEVVEVADNVKKAQTRLNLGRQFMDKGLMDMAGSEFEKAVELDPRNVEALAELGGFHLRQKEYEKALSNLSKAIELNPESIDAHFSLGILHRKQGELDKAASEFEGVIELKPTHAEAFRELARIFEEKGETEKALENYRAALRLIFETDSTTD
jgi:tetratricopeptide (TPR) repeat protein